MNLTLEEATSGFFDNSNLIYKAGYLDESEQLYGSTSLYQTLRWGKDVSEMFRIDVFSHLEYSRRVQVDVPDRERWYDNSGLAAKFNFGDVHKVEAFGSASISDTTFTSYGARYKFTAEWDEFRITNLAEGGYDYFYYWNQVGQDFASDNIDLRYSSLDLSLSYFYGNVRNNYIDGYDIKGRNPNQMFNLGLSYDFMRSPRINAGFYYQYRNFEYYSPLYYSPQDRKLAGFGAFMFDTFGKFYIYAGGGTKRDNDSNLIWNLDAEAGYENDGMSFSAGWGRYYDPYYRNTNVFLSFTNNF